VSQDNSEDPKDLDGMVKEMLLGPMLAIEKPSLLKRIKTYSASVSLLFSGMYAGFNINKAVKNRNISQGSNMLGLNLSKSDKDKEVS
jgi:hypothetical protein